LKTCTTVRNRGVRRWVKVRPLAASAKAVEPEEPFVDHEARKRMYEALRNYPEAADALLAVLASEGGGWTPDGAG
jgi:hypothetical protein